MSSTTTKPLVTIIIPVYNGSNYMRAAIDSALAQTYDNIEVLVVNDGSDDAGATADIAASYGQRIRYLEKPNGGVASALNAGILFARGDYLSWLSHDDLYTPEKVLVQIRYLEELEEPDAIVFADYLNVDADNNPLYPVLMNHDELAAKPMYAVFRGALHGCTLLIPRKVFTDVGLFRDLPTTQDYDMWFRMVRSWTFRHLPRVLVRSRMHPEQGSRKFDAAVEANQLWIDMMSDLSTEEILRMEDSEAEFFAGMHDFLHQHTPYQEAWEFAAQRASQVHSSASSAEPAEPAEDIVQAEADADTEVDSDRVAEVDDPPASAPAAAPLPPPTVRRKRLVLALQATGLLTPVNRVRDGLAALRHRSEAAEPEVAALPDMPESTVASSLAAHGVAPQSSNAQAPVPVHEIQSLTQVTREANLHAGVAKVLAKTISGARD